jgi:hypothetical protein
MAMAMQIQLNQTSKMMVQKEYADFIKMLGETYKVSVNIDTSSFAKLAASNQTAMSGIKQNTATTTAAMSQSIADYQERAGVKLDALGKKFAGVWDNPEVAAARQKFETSLSSLGTGEGTIAQANTSLMQLRNTLGEVSQTSQSALGNLGAIFGKFSLWIGVSTALMSTLHAISGAFEDTASRSKVFTTIQMEMARTKLNYDDVIAKANEYAIATGSTTDSVLKAISIFANYNSTLEETLSKSKAAIMLSNVSGKSIEESASDISAALAQFHMGSDQAMHVADVVEAVSRTMTVDFPEAITSVSEGFKKAGAIVHEGGTSFEMYAAMLGTMVDKTRLSGKNIAPLYSNI